MIYNMQMLLESQGFADGSFTGTPRQFIESLNRSERRKQRQIEQNLTPERRAALKRKQHPVEQHWQSVERFLRGLTPLRQLIVNELMKFGKAFTTISVSLDTLSERLTCSKRSISRAFEQLYSFGLMSKKARWNKSSLRHLHPVLNDPRLKVRLWKYFEVYRDYYQTASRNLLLWLMFQKDAYNTRLTRDVQKGTCSDTDQTLDFQKAVHLELRVINTSISSKEDTQLYKRVNTHSREVIVNCSTQVTGDSMEHPVEPSEIAAAIRERRKEVASTMSPLLKDRVTKLLHLTAKGQLKLMRYCDGALLYGLECLNKHGLNETSINFRLFEAGCIEYSRNNDIKIDAYGNETLLHELSYVEAQHCFKKLTLDAPLAQHVANPPSPTKAKYERTLRREPQRHTPYLEEPLAPLPTTINRHIDRGNKMIAANPQLNDVFIALALKLGFEDSVPIAESSQISIKDEDK